MWKRIIDHVQFFKRCIKALRLISSITKARAVPFYLALSSDFISVLCFKIFGYVLQFLRITLFYFSLISETFIKKIMAILATLRIYNS